MRGVEGDLVLPFTFDGCVPLTSVPGAVSRPIPEHDLVFVFDNWLVVNLTGVTRLGHLLLSSMPSTLLLFPDRLGRVAVWAGDYVRCRILLYPRLHTLNKVLDTTDPRLTGGREVRAMLGVVFQRRIAVVLAESYLAAAKGGPILMGRIIESGAGPTLSNQGRDESVGYV